VARVEPLSAPEEEFWRALMRIVLSLPRRLDTDLVRAAGITANEYTVLMCLSEVPDGNCAWLTWPMPPRCLRVG